MAFMMLAILKRELTMCWLGCSAGGVTGVYDAGHPEARTDDVLAGCAGKLCIRQENLLQNEECHGNYRADSPAEATISGH
jgi:hypothetical protein